jgi:hypothetical protein
MNSFQVNSSLNCFYDPIGLEQARFTILNLLKAESTFKFWLFSTVYISIISVLIVSLFIINLVMKIHQFIQSRRRVTAPIAMQPINFA